MRTNKTYSVAGFSMYNGTYCVRYANSTSRASVLERNGHTDVQLWEFPEALAQEDLVDSLLDLNLERNSGEAVKTEARRLGFVL